MCFVWIWEQTAIISLYSINWLVCITETGCVYCAVRPEFLYTIQVTLMAESRLRSPAKPMWDLWWTYWHRDRFFSRYFCFPLSTSAPYTPSTTCSYQKPKRANPRNLPKSNTLSEKNEQHQLQKYFYLVLNKLSAIYLNTSTCYEISGYEVMWASRRRKLRTDKLQTLNWTPDKEQVREGSIDQNKENPRLRNTETKK